MSVFFRIKGLFLIFLISLHFCVSSMSNYRKVCHILYREAVFSLEDYQALEKSSLLEEFWSQGRKRHLLYSSLLFAKSGEGNGIPLQYSCLENPLDRGAWKAAVHGVPKSRTRLSDFTFTFHFYALEKEMATHSSVLAWRLSGKGEPGGLPSMGSHRVGHDWSNLAAAAAASAVVAKSCLNLLGPYGLKPARLLCPWDFPGKKTGVGCDFFL